MEGGAVPGTLSAALGEYATGLLHPHGEPDDEEEPDEAAALKKTSLSPPATL